MYSLANTAIATSRRAKEDEFLPQRLVPFHRVVPVLEGYCQ
ncbi:hypothetical protein OROHE_012508 [Orobanche hederae]